ncbi:hypothetical protein KJ940_07915, partial [Myxococcota bacterium]|nr:hypothetical protein [Myxococcota bacterium]
MKTKAYKLATKLKVEEGRLLDWLRAHGYPNIRRTDTIRAEVARAAQQALSRARHEAITTPSPPPTSPTAPALTS